MTNQNEESDMKLTSEHLKSLHERYLVELKKVSRYGKVNHQGFA